MGPGSLCLAQGCFSGVGGGPKRAGERMGIRRGGATASASPRGAHGSTEVGSPVQAHQPGRKSVELDGLVAEPHTTPHSPLAEFCRKGSRGGESGWGLDVWEGFARGGSSGWFVLRVPHVLEMVQEREADGSEGLEKVPGCLSLIRRKADPLPDSRVVPDSLLQGSMSKAIRGVGWVGDGVCGV